MCHQNNNKMAMRVGAFHWIKTSGVCVCASAQRISWLIEKTEIQADQRSSYQASVIR